MQPYPGPGFRKQVTSRGNYPIWRKDGREIVYLDEYLGRNYIWSVPVAVSGAEFRAVLVGPVSGSSSRDDLRGLELPGPLARRLTLLYSTGGGTAELRRYPRPRGMGKMTLDAAGRIDRAALA